MTLPYTTVEFTKAGDPADLAQFDDAITMVRGVTDVLMIAHGWNNDIPSAERMMTALSHNVEDRLAGRFAGRSLAVVRLLWPSKQWGSDAADTAGRGLSVGDSAKELKATIRATVEDPIVADRLAQLADEVDRSSVAQAEFLSLLRAQLPRPEAVADDDAMPVTLRAGATGEVFDTAADAEHDLIVQLIHPSGTRVPGHNSPFEPLPDPLAGASTAGAGILDIVRSPVRAARELLNVTTFFKMKHRAGEVGLRGVALLLDAVHKMPRPVRVHLAGHSFGARVVAMAVATTTTKVASVSLLQGAFSHRGLAAADDESNMPEGAFRRLATGMHLEGPVIVTHTRNDRAVRLAYALASRLAKQSGAGLGDASDPYGGIGANGAVGTVEAVPWILGDQDTTYEFEPRVVYNLQSDRFVDHHSDITNPAVANAVAAAVATGPARTTGSR